MAALLCDFCHRSLFAQDLLKELDIGWHFIESFREGDGDVELLKHLDEALKLFLRWVL